ncbi:MAG: tetratricopeptide repeat protein [Deltaproteobacteria bacterium]|nr:tetratricopeptide repeat protein [Deltaproteobacteria bacterium]
MAKQPVKKTAPAKKAAPKNAALKKAAPNKTAPKQAAPKQAAPKKAAPAKKVAPKKAAPANKTTKPVAVAAVEPVAATAVVATRMTNGASNGASNGDSRAKQGSSNTVSDAPPHAPANENTPATTMATPPPIATIAPRGVFLPDRVIVDVEGDTFPSTKLDEHGRDEAILPATTLAAICAKATEGHQHLEVGDMKAAFSAFVGALELVPRPFENWNVAGWLLVAMGECAIRAGDFQRALQPLRDAMHCPGTVGNPWVHLRLGQARLENADERAVDDLSRAYMGGGRSLFEDLDPKYFAVVEKTLEPPPGHDRLP